MVDRQVENVPRESIFALVAQWAQNPVSVFFKLGGIAFFTIRFAPESNNEFVLRIRLGIDNLIFIFVYSFIMNTNE